MKRIIIIICVFLIGIFAQIKSFANTSENGKKYKKEWKTVDSLDKLGLPKSALEIVEKIYKMAKSDINNDQIIKAMMYRMKYLNSSEENSFERLLTDINKEINESSLQNRHLLYSVKAEMHFMYYQNNRYQILERSNTINFNNEDIKTWTADQLLDATIKNYLHSLSEKDSLFKTNMKFYDEIVSFGSDARIIRPTLYDFLASRALQFFQSSELTLTRPADFFQLKEENYFGQAEDFIKFQAKSSDSLSLHYYAIKIYKDWLSLRLKDNNRAALIDLDLNRMQFIYSKSVNPNKEQLYLDALQKLQSQNADNAEYAEISYYLASYFHIRSSGFHAAELQTFKFQFDKKTALELCESAIEKFPKSYGTGMCSSLKAEIMSGSLGFTIEKILAPNTKIPLLLEYRNIKKIYGMVGSIDPKQLEKIFNKEYGDKLFNLLKKSVKPIKSISFDLKGTEDFNNHSTEILLDELPIGTYIIFVANNEKLEFQKNISTYAIINVTNISYVQRTNSEGSSENYVFDRNTGKPIKDVTVKEWFDQYNYSTGKYEKQLHGTYVTDSEGYFKVQTDKKNYSRNVTYEFFYGTDYFNSDQNIYLYSNDFKPVMESKVFLFTDRAIYRPGQIIYFKGIMLKTDGEKSEVISNSQNTITLYDVNFQKVGEQTLTSNEYGSFSGNFIIPKGLINGTMQLYCYNGSKYISVEEYKRPKFQVEISPLKGNYVLNDSVKVSGKAMAFAGSMISDAKVKYRIIRKPIWSGWWYYSMPETETQMAEGTVITDEMGGFEIKFMALPDLKFQKNEYLLFNYTISVDVTDLNGETQSATKSMSVGYTSLRLNLDINAQIPREEVSEAEIFTTNVNGEFIEAKGEIKIYKLKSLENPLRNRVWTMPDQFSYTVDEWKKQFPGNVYKDENNYQTREIEQLVFTKEFNTADSKKLNLSVIKDWEPGIYVAETKSKDAFGNPIEWKNYFTLYSKEKKELPDKQVDWFVQVNQHAEPGENAKFMIGSSLQDVQILYEIEVKNKIVEKKWIKPEGFQQLIEIPVIEEYRGNFGVHFTFLINNRFYKHDATVIVPRTNKMLDITFETFRDKIYPGQDEEWKIKIKGKNGEKVAAEFLATLYDASLDQFRPNSWDFNFYNSYYATQGWQCNVFGIKKAIVLTKDFNRFVPMPYRTFDYLNWFGFSYYAYDIYDFGISEEREYAVNEMVVTDAPKKTKNGRNKGVALPSVAGNVNKEDNGDLQMEEDIVGVLSNVTHGVVISNQTVLDNIKVRTNFNETAFFYPNLQTDEEGNIIVKFKIPESLTSWKMMGFAHSKDLKYGFASNELKTQKDLMLLPNEPRFLRQNDQIVFPVKISNITKNLMNGTARLELFDAISMKPIEGIFDKKESAIKNFTVGAESNTNVEWKLSIPDYLGAVSYKVVAQSGNFSDGEQKALLVLSNRMMVTESLPLPIRGKQSKDFELTKLVKSKKSNSLKNFKLTLEFSSNPAWYAIQALPYIMEYPYECAEQTFSRLYANSIASHIANSTPKVKWVFDSWKETPGSESFLSNLEKNQDLKSALLEETPWVLQAGNEQERKKRIGLLFDLNRMADELGRATIKLQKTQASNGGWPWFEGMPESRYITQHIVEGFGHLDHLGIKSVREDEKTWTMLKKAIVYLDRAIKEDYDWLKRNLKSEDLEKNQLSHMAIHYLYGRSFFKDLEIPKSSKEAYEYYLKQSEKYWLSQDLYCKGMIALYLSRYDKKMVTDIIKSLKEFSTENEEMGMYWKNNIGGYYWYQAPIETQVLMVEVFNEVAKSKTDVDALKVWLLKQKQTQDWKTTKATTEAIYALLLTGGDWLESDELVKIKLGDQLIDPKKMENVKIEAGTGYFKTSWSGNEIIPEMGKVHLEKTNDGVAWGALYWQYFEDLDKITPHETPLKLTKKLFVERITEKGKAIELIDKKTILVVGDKVIVRIELRVDREMEYVHMKDMRASGFEPLNVFSRYKYQDGLGYYESTKDAATNFFMSYLPKGTYVFEYPLRVTHQGDFSNGVTSIQCMYAPEFTSHSEGIRVIVAK